jgi:hypothetical protein
VADPAERIAQMVAAQSVAHRRVVARRMVGRGLLALVFVALVAGGGVLLVRRGEAPSTGHTLTGRLQLIQARGQATPTFTRASGSPRDCVGAGDNSEVQVGMPISVEDERGVLIGRAWLGSGQVTTPGSRSSPACSFAFTIHDLASATTYRITPGDRDPVDVSLEQLQSAGWEVTLTIGP